MVILKLVYKYLILLYQKAEPMTLTSPLEPGSDFVVASVNRILCK